MQGVGAQACGPAWEGWRPGSAASCPCRGGPLPEQRWALRDCGTAGTQSPGREKSRRGPHSWPQGMKALVRWALRAQPTAFPRSTPPGAWAPPKPISTGPGLLLRLTARPTEWPRSRPVVLRIGSSPSRPALGAGVGGRDEALGALGRVPTVRWRVSRGLARGTTQGESDRPAAAGHSSWHRLVPEGREAAITMATSTPRAPSARRILDAGAGLTAERVPPAPCAAITIATRASRRLGRRPRAAITMATRAGADGRGQGGRGGARAMDRGETCAPDFPTSPW